MRPGTAADLQETNARRRETYSKGAVAARNPRTGTYNPTLGPEPAAGHRYNGAESCPVVNTEGGGSTLLVFVLIVIVPVGMILLWGLLYLFGPRMLVPTGPCSVAVHAHALGARL